MHRLYAFLVATVAITLTSCREAPMQTAGGSDSATRSAITDSPHDLLIGALDELERLAGPLPLGRHSGGGTLFVLTKGVAETTYVYGEITSEGYGAVVTERHSYPKGIPLITVRKTFGKEQNMIVSELNRYTSQADHEAGRPEQTSLTEVVGLSQDTILTRIIRNGQIETYTFRLPVVTVTLKSEPELTRRVSRYSSQGEIVVETRDGNDALIQRRRNSTLPDGSLVALTEYPDGSWRRTRTVGRSDGTILRENASSE